MKELIAIQNELKAPKNNKNNFGNYNYRSCENILESVKPLLKKHNCGLIIHDDIIQVGDRVYVKATASIKMPDGVVNESTGFAREAQSKKGMDDAQITGSASSYARKYALCGLFLIDDNQDIDSMKPEEPKKKPAPKKTKKPSDPFEVIDLTFERNPSSDTIVKLNTHLKTIKYKTEDDFCQVMDYFHEKNAEHYIKQESEGK